MAYEEPKDEIAFVREIIRHELWSANYHAVALQKAYSDMAFAEELIKHGDFKEVELPDDEDASFENIDQFVTHILYDMRGGVEHHERELKKAHTNAAFAGVMLARGNYTEIDLSEVREAAKYPADETNG